MISGSAFLAPGSYPLLSARRTEAPGRFWAIPFVGILVKEIILIPVVIWLYILSVVTWIMVVVNSFSVLFSGQYMQTAYDLAIGLMRLEAKIGLYVAGLTDRYPGFSLDIPPDELFSVDMAMPESPNRGFAIPILGGLARGVLLIPFAIWAQIVATGTVVAVIVASFPVLFSGRYPVSMFELVRDTSRLYGSYICYAFGLSDSYPSFSISMNNAGVKWIFLAIGILLFVVQIFGNLAPLMTQSSGR